MKKFILSLIILMLGIKTYAATDWVNDSRALFQDNGMVILGVNIRTFNAKDTNKNGVIESKLGEEAGNFINAVDRLDELVLNGVNTIHLLPITPVGKTKAYGTAGSLYALNAFNAINPQLSALKSTISLNNQVRYFIEECHKRRICVLVDLPAFTSYDYYLAHGNMFSQNYNSNLDLDASADMRFPDAGTEWTVNETLLNNYISFFDFMMGLGVDGVVANHAYTKPAKFWAEIIKHVRSKDEQFLFLAHATDEDYPVSDGAPVTSCKRLLDVGFDGYYGGYSRLSEWKSAKELYNQVRFNQRLFSGYKNIKSAIGSFATVDSPSPVLVHGPQYAIMIAWLNATLPLNSYFLDGFQSGDDYNFPLANKHAKMTATDNEFFYVKPGRMDIYNFSRKPGGQNGDILQNFVLANKFKSMMGASLRDASFVPLHTSSSSVFAYIRSNSYDSILVVGNLDFENLRNVKVHIPKLTEKMSIIPIKFQGVQKVASKTFNTILSPGEIQVFMIKNYSIK